MARNSTTAGQHDFARIPHTNVPRTKFNRSNGMKTTIENFGELVPVFVDETLPGDTMIMEPTFFARLATQVVPVMDNMYIDIHWWACPNRLIWDNWQKFCGEQVDPGDSTDFTIPQVAMSPSGSQANGFFDHIGIPPNIEYDYVNNLYGRAYRLIWNEWYRAESLQDSVTVDTGNGPDSMGTYQTLLPRGKRHDYFTSCLPWPQKGPSVELPLGSSAPITDHTGLIALESDGTAGNKIPDFATTPSVGPQPVIADLSAATAATVNELRNSIAIQQLYEKDARGGTRYKEILLSHFGRTVKDSRLQRPEYLGGGTIPVGVNQVVQNSGFGATGEHEKMGSLAAWATAVKTGNGFSKTFDEHSVIIGLISARADLNYQQGISRDHTRQTRWDFYWPNLANIGEQAVLNKEIYAQGESVTEPDGTLTDNAVFGYQERFAEYRYKPSMVTGKFRSSHIQTLDIWHLAQDFASLPELGDTFIQENPPIDRILAVPSESALLLDCFFDYKSVRPMPQYGVPGLTRL